MTLLRYRPQTFGLFDRLFDEFVAGPPDMPVQADADGWTLKLALPGVAPDAIDLTVQGKTLLVTVDTRDAEDQQDGGYRAAMNARRSFSWLLPDGIDQDAISATSEHGVLTIRVPKGESAKPKRIAINPGTTGAKAIGAGTGSTVEQPAKEPEAVTS